MTTSYQLFIAPVEIFFPPIFQRHVMVGGHSAKIFFYVKIMPSVQVSVCMAMLSTIYMKDFSGFGLLVEIYTEPTKQPM